MYHILTKVQGKQDITYNKYILRRGNNTFFSGKLNAGFNPVVIYIYIYICMYIYNAIERLRERAFINKLKYIINMYFHGALKRE